MATASLTGLLARQPSRRPVPGMTLLELVTRLGRVLEDDREVVDATHALLDAGRVRLTGSFRGRPLRDRTG